MRRFYSHIALYAGAQPVHFWQVEDHAHQEQVLAALKQHFSIKPYDCEQARQVVCAWEARIRPSVAKPPLTAGAGLAPLTQHAVLADAAGRLQVVHSGIECGGRGMTGHPPTAWLGHQLNVAAYMACRDRVVYVKQWKRAVSELVFEGVPEDGCFELRVQTRHPETGTLVAETLTATIDDVHRLNFKVPNRDLETLAQIRAFALANELL